MKGLGYTTARLGNPHLQQWRPTPQLLSNTKPAKSTTTVRRIDTDSTAKVVLTQTRSTKRFAPDETIIIEYEADTQHLAPPAQSCTA